MVPPVDRPGGTAMPPQELLLWVFCLVDDELQALNLTDPRSRGPAPTLTDAEVITIELVGEFWGLDADRALYRHFRAYHAAEFPNLAEVCRTTFARQAAPGGRVGRVRGDVPGPLPAPGQGAGPGPGRPAQRGAVPSGDGQRPVGRPVPREADVGAGPVAPDQPGDPQGAQPHGDGLDRAAPRARPTLVRPPPTGRLNLHTALAIPGRPLGATETPRYVFPTRRLYPLPGRVRVCGCDGRAVGRPRRAPPADGEDRL